MYSFDVNFLKERYLEQESKLGKSQETSKKIDLGKQFPLIAGAVVMVLLPSFAWGWLLTINAQKDKAEKEIQELDARITQLDAQRQQIRELEQQLAKVNDVPNAIVSVLNQVKPVSVVLQDLRDLLPDGIEVQSITQAAPVPPGENAEFPTIKFTLSGRANNYDDANDLLLSLQQSDFIKPESTKLTTAAEAERQIEWLDPNVPKLLERENIKIEFPKIVNYTIETELNQVPASKLIRSLENRGAVGLVTWIRTLDQKGFDQKGFEKP